MKFTADASSLLDALTTAGRGMPRTSTMPILETVLATAGDGSLTLRGCNLAQHVEATCEVQHDPDHNGPRVAALPQGRITDTLKALPDDTDVQVLVDSDYTLRIETDQGSYEMLAQQPDNFPDLPDVDPDTAIEVGDLIDEGIARTSFATADDALRPAMEGMLLEPNGERSYAVATDGHRLSRLRLDLDIAGPNLILPNDALSMMERIDGSLLQVGPDHVVLRSEGAAVYTRVIDETYPNYESVIPDNDDTMEVRREELLGAVKRAGIYTSSMTNQIRLTVSPDHLVVEGEDVERSSESEETVPCNYDGDEPLEIGFNSQYLQEVLSVTESEQVRFELSSPNRAAVARPVGNDDLTLLIMPVMLNEY